MAHLTIIPVDNTVAIDGVGYTGLDFSTLNIPSNVSALQWDGSAGWIEFTTTIPNEDITALPAWATHAKVLWQTAKDAEDAENVTNVENVQPAEYMVDRSSEIETKLKEYKKVSIETLNKLNKTFTGLYVEPFIRDNDAAIIGVEIHIPSDHNKTVQEGSATMLSMKAVKEYYATKGIPIIANGNKTYAHRAEEMHNAFANIGYDVIHSNGDLWIFTPWTLDMAKAHKKASINVERNASISNGYNDGVNTWDIDSQSMTNMTSKVIGLADDDSVTWRSKTNTDVTMTGSEFKTLVKNAVLAVDTIYQNSWARKAAVDNASTEDALDAI